MVLLDKACRAKPLTAHLSLSANCPEIGDFICKLPRLVLLVLSLMGFSCSYDLGLIFLYFKCSRSHRPLWRQVPISVAFFMALMLHQIVFYCPIGKRCSLKLDRGTTGMYLHCDRFGQAVFKLRDLLIPETFLYSLDFIHRRMSFCCIWYVIFWGQCFCGLLILQHKNFLISLTKFFVYWYHFIQNVCT